MSTDAKSSLEEKINQLRLPEGGEVFGFVEEALGSNHLKVRCGDGRTRECRIPGRMQKRTWIDEGDVVVVEPWQVQRDERGDVVHRYTKEQAEWLSRKGIPTREPE